MASRASVENRADIDEAVDGVGGPEGTFTICTFWYVENLARAGTKTLVRSSKIR